MWCILLVFFCTCCYVGFLNSGDRSCVKWQVCLWEEIYNTWKDLTAKSCSYVCFPLGTRNQGHSLLSLLYSMLHICLHTLFCESLANDKLKPLAYVLGNFSGFLSQRRKKTLESTADVNSDCIHITSKRSRMMDGLAKKLIDSQKFENSPRFQIGLCHLFLVFLTAATISGELPKIQKQHLSFCQPSLRQHEMMWARWMSTVYAHLSGRCTTMPGCFLSICNSWNSLNTWRWYILRLLKDCWKPALEGNLP